MNSMLPQAPKAPVGSGSVRFAGPRPGFSVRLTEIAALREDGSTIFGQRRAPTLPEFDHAFAAFAQGTVFKAENGFRAVEDIQPGDWLMTSTGRLEQVTWIGSAVFSQADQGGPLPLTRIMTDSFGINRPDSFVSFGPAARLLQTPPDMRGSTVTARLVTPASRFLDGVSVVEAFPPTPVRMFQIAMRRHVALVANGLLVESYHPGPNPVAHMTQTLRAAFQGLFPHLEDLSGFGPMQFARAPEEQTAANEN
ncbi:MAG: Hint domain-containing protein [Pseudomonadota bacterium]